MKFYGSQRIQQQLAYLKNYLTEKFATKQDKLTFDNVPTQDSENPVRSGGVYEALSGKANIASLAAVATSGSFNDLLNIPTIDSSLSNSSTNAVQNKVLNAALVGKSNTGHTHVLGDITDFTIDSALSSESTNPVANNVIRAALSEQMSYVNAKALWNTIASQTVQLSQGDSYGHIDIDDLDMGQLLEAKLVVKFTAGASSAYSFESTFTPSLQDYDNVNNYLSMGNIYDGSNTYNVSAYLASNNSTGGVKIRIYGIYRDDTNYLNYAPMNMTITVKLYGKYGTW